MRFDLMLGAKSLRVSMIAIAAATSVCAATANAAGVSKHIEVASFTGPLNDPGTKASLFI